jgi:hypothetical protein
MKHFVDGASRAICRLEAIVQASVTLISALLLLYSCSDVMH